MIDLSTNAVVKTVGLYGIGDGASNRPSAIQLDSAGDAIYEADSGYNRISGFTLSTGRCSSLGFTKTSSGVFRQSEPPWVGATVETFLARVLTELFAIHLHSH